ncbi:pyridoxal phosphate-dependent aminotransferase [Marispirochaeta aestuarii]|uniref:pyridoxal phosphate-dependent aminotransferase n=1 Tax=Marispirochaeta aestuarii TaxID=1963862 RepID=UPI0029C66709|nr:pyridoxal phosphate-dependent aminotransferase [Marispirochaeta aestuarii]
MRRPIVWDGAGELRYEIREIVRVAHRIAEAGLPVVYENIGDPVQKGEEVPSWIKDIVVSLTQQDASYCYTDSQGDYATREFLAAKVSARGGAQIGLEDIYFFNGLGDAVARIFGYLKREARVIGPSPAYSTLSSAEASHSGYEHLTYRLDPDNNWMPDISDIENKVRYNPSIAGILLINPDNPTGAVYPRETITAMIDIARRYDLFVICDETYANIIYNPDHSVPLSEVIDGVPGMALRSISKEYPWPGGRCGWIEVYNQKRDPEFARYITSILDAKRLEVCSTTLPQMSIPRVFSDPRYADHLKHRNAVYEQRALEATEILSSVPGMKVIKPKGAFYITAVFDEGLLTDTQSLPVKKTEIGQYLNTILPSVAPDKRFVYYLLASAGICVVPLSGFCCDLPGFRATLLESDDRLRKETWLKIADSVRRYTGA